MQWKSLNGLLLALALLSSVGVAQAGSWFEEQQMTPEGEKLYGAWFKSCCDGGDVFKTRFRSVENDGSLWGKEHYQYWKDGQWLNVPPEIVRHGKTPDGQPVLFLYTHHNNAIQLEAPICFVIDEPGI